MSFDPEKYAVGWRAANERERAEIDERAEKARSEAWRLATLIGERDEAVRAVYLFGSLARGVPARLDFDIDLALDGGDTYKAMDAVADSEFEIDVVDLALLPAWTRERILESGERLFTR